MVYYYMVLMIIYDIIIYGSYNNIWNFEMLATYRQLKKKCRASIWLSEVGWQWRKSYITRVIKNKNNMYFDACTKVDYVGNYIFTCGMPM